MTSLLTCAWLIRPPVKNQNMCTEKYSFTKKALTPTLPLLAEFFHFYGQIPIEIQITLLLALFA